MYWIKSFGTYPGELRLYIKFQNFTTNVGFSQHNVLKALKINENLCVCMGGGNIGEITGKDSGRKKF